MLILQNDVRDQLEKLKLDIYQELFEAKRYSDDVDVENLIGLKEKDLQEMGATKRGKNQ